MVEGAAALVPRPFRVRRVRRELHDTRTLEIEPLDGGGAPAFEPGQFNMLYAFGVGEIPISMSGDPARTASTVHTIRSVGAVSRALTALAKGQALGVRGPFGTGWPVAEAKGRDVLVVAGGLGLAPLRPAVYRLLAERRSFGRVSLLVGARTPDDLLFAAELARWRARFDVDVRVSVDRAPGEWHGDVGVVTKLFPHVRFDPGRTTAFICGPEVMMRFAAAALRDLGVAPEAAWISMERNMKCAVGVCGHCQFGPSFVCKDGPVFRYSAIQPLLGIREA